jgi:hypothetical protein
MTAAYMLYSGAAHVELCALSQTWKIGKMVHDMALPREWYQ